MLVFLVTVSHFAYSKEQTDIINCSELKDTECIERSACVISTDKEPVCREAISKCEIDFYQGFEVEVDNKSLCENKDGCKYIEPGPCFCPPNVTCVCGGGKPPECVDVEKAYEIPYNKRLILPRFS